MAKYIAKDFFQAEFGALLREDILILPALLYLIFSIALAVFVIFPALEKKSIKDLILKGALFGFTTYATFDLTSYAIINNFSINIVIVDLLWGMFVSISSAAVVYKFYK